MSSIVALICARGGSKGLPGKNIRMFCGRPLIAHAIEFGKNLDYVEQVIVSTDDEEIAQVSRENGANVPFLRPAALATDKAAEWLVWQHAITYLEGLGEKIETLIVLPPTAPLRTQEDVNAAVAMQQNNTCDGVVCATTSHRNPYFNMVTVSREGYCQVEGKKGERVTRRQDAPSYFDLTTVCYVMSAQYIRENKHLFDGKILINEISSENAIDIDTLHDFELAEFLYLRRTKQ